MFQQNTGTEGAVLRALEHIVCDGDTWWEHRQASNSHTLCECKPNSFVRLTLSAWESPCTKLAVSVASSSTEHNPSKCYPRGSKLIVKLTTASILCSVAHYTAAALGL